jgi:hypothetical protein
MPSLVENFLEIDAWVAEYVLGHNLILQKKGAIKERDRLGNIRPLRPYSKDINAAWEVVRELSITLIPIAGGSWFALVGKEDGWASPAEIFEYLKAGDFVQSGAAVAKNPALSICLAALRAVQKNKGLAFEGLDAALVSQAS